MMAETNMAYVEQGAIDAVLQAVRLMREAGDTRGALRELEHFVTALKDNILVPLGDMIEKAAGETDEFPWIVKSRPERYRLPC
jgi:hypothetical protein